MHTLKKLSEDALCHWLSWLRDRPQDKIPDARRVWKFLQPAAALLMNVATRCSYDSQPYVTQIFLPMLVSKGRLHITPHNLKEVLLYFMENKPECENNESSMKQVKVEDVEGSEHYLSFLPFLGNLKNLTVLVIGSVVNDDLLSVLGINCPLLQIIDSREDTGNMVSDVGLAYLSQCRKLKHVYFSAFADGYDAVSEQLGFSGRGVALLLLLPEIKNVICSEYLLGDALHFLYQARYQRQTLRVRCMLLEHLEVSYSTFQILPILCPELEVVALRVDSGKERGIGNSLSSLVNLRILIMTMESGIKLRDTLVTGYGHQLSFLYITTYILDSENIILLSHSCPQLKTLVLKMYSFGFDGVAISDLKKPLFPSVEKLELRQNISVRLFKYLNTQIKNIQEVHCGWATIHNIEDALKVVLKAGAWQQVEYLALPMTCEISFDLIVELMSSLPNLKHLVVMVQRSKEGALQQYIRQSAPGLRWSHYPEVSPSTSGCLSHDVWTTAT
ncbi:hypothetical protein Pmani_032564 [Petrolisthes manimaculis]|uniref:Uncharacterized protein n=1 Tax=Petrolisthes manimaculis TaxID=1843537 RepID=A0AAE1NRH0_9EUCA|nr:hypothetical protein Pmani_032564 [Petrolisthes manimaculis]